jgi:putative radical SAM enzyme (TIGR03279 family)
VVVAAVRPRSPAAAGGLVAGDHLLTINGQPLRDAIDVQFHASDEVLDVELERAGVRRRAILVRRPGDLGLELVAPRPGAIATCANKCVFCFIHQLPRGMRRSLYVKDDDYRLSFLHGNYITLSDLSEEALARIVEQRLSPLYVSVHATDPALRHRLLGRPRHSAEILPRLGRLARAGIRVHAQIVLCPDWNDGPALERTVAELAPLAPQVATVAVVPVGLTRHRERLPDLRPLRDDEARALIETVTGWQEQFLTSLGTRFVFLADEVYLQSGRDLPPARAYEGFAIAEDGVGLVRRFEDAFARSVSARRRWGRAPRHMSRARCTGLVCGPAGRLTPHGVAARVAECPTTSSVGVSVAGLLTGQDIQRHLEGQRDLGAAVLVPAVAIRDGEGVFLDDLTPGDLAAALGVPVRVIEPTARGLLDALLRAA